MKLLVATLTLSATLASAAAGNCAKPFATEFRSGQNLEMDIRSGDIRIEGSDEQTISVECSAADSRRIGDITVDLQRVSGGGKLRVEGGPNDDVKIRIRVPKQVNLVLRCPAGDVDVLGLRGSKDIVLRAGDLTVQVGDPKEYATAEASVKAGDIDARVFGKQTGGLFRSFSHKNPSGKYHLRATLWAGDLKFQ